MSTIAGGNYLGDDGPALAAVFDQPEGIAADANGNVYISDSVGHRVRRIALNGTIRTIAGTGVPGYAGDGQAASMARLNAPYGLAADRFDNLYIADLQNGRVRRMAADGKLSTFAGGGARIPTADERIPATDTKLLAPRNIAVDAFGNVFISDFFAHRVYRVGLDGMLSLVAGAGTAGFSGDGALASKAQLNFPCGLAVDRQGVLYIADSANRRVRRVYQNFITSVAELGATGTNALGLATPTGLAIDAAGTLYIADGRASLVSIAALGHVSSVPAGSHEVAVDSGGSLLLARQGSRAVFKYAAGLLTTFAGIASLPDVLGDGAPASGAQLRTPGFLALDNAGNLAFADTFSRRVRLIDNRGVIKSVAGSSAPPAAPEPAVAQANSISLARPGGVAWDPQGNLYVSDLAGHRIRKIASSGETRVIAGKPEPGFSGDGGLAIDAVLNAPASLAIAGDGSLYFADSGNHRVRRITPSGHIFTVAGGGPGRAGEDGASVGITLEEPFGVAVDREGNLYFTETTGNRLRMVNAAGQMVTLADAANLLFPRGIALDSLNNLWIADSGNHRIRTLSPQGTMLTVAGSGVEGFSGDGGDAALAEFDTPFAVWTAPDGSVYVSDSGNHRIRKLTPEGAATTPPGAPPTTPPTPPPTTPPIGAPTAQATVLHGATLRESAVAPGMLASLSGQGLGPAGAVAGRMVNGKMETSVGATEVRFDGVPAPLLYVQDKQVNLQVPQAVAGRSRTEITVVRNGVAAGQFSVAVSSPVPGILTRTNGAGQAIAVREDGLLNTVDAPLTPGAIVSFYVTGDGSSGSDGVAATSAESTRARVTADIGGYAAEVQYAGKAPGLLGVMQVNARINPSTRMSGALPLTVRIDGVPSQEGVSLYVR